MSLTTPRSRFCPVNWTSHLHGESMPAQRVICSGQVWCPSLCRGAPKRGSTSQGIPPPRGRGPGLEGPLRAVLTLAAQQADGWLHICWMQAEGLLQTGADMDPIIGGFSSNLIIAGRGTGLKVWVWVANTMLIISGFSREITQSKKVGSVWDLGRPNPISGFMLFWFL